MKIQKWKSWMRLIKARRKKMYEKTCRINNLQNKKTNTLKHGMIMIDKSEKIQGSFRKISMR